MTDQINPAMKVDRDAKPLGGVRSGGMRHLLAGFPAVYARVDLLADADVTDRLCGVVVAGKPDERDAALVGVPDLFAVAVGPGATSGRGPDYGAGWPSGCSPSACFVGDRDQHTGRDVPGTAEQSLAD